MKIYIAYGVSVCLLLSGVSMGATAVFNPITGDWNVPGNWDIGVVPTAVDDARVQTSGTTSQAHITTTNTVDRLLQENGGGLTIEPSGILTMRQVLIGNATSSRGSTLTIDGGQLNCTAEFALGNNGGGATMIINSGTANANGGWLIPGYQAGAGGAVIVNGGALNTAGHLRPGYLGDGSLVVNDGYVNIGDQLIPASKPGTFGDVVIRGGITEATGWSFQGEGTPTLYLTGGQLITRSGGVAFTERTTFHMSGGELVFLGGGETLYTDVLGALTEPNWKFHGTPSVVSNFDGSVVVSCIPDPNIVTNATISTGGGNVLGVASDDFQGATVTDSSMLVSTAFSASDLFSHGSPSMIKEDTIFADWRGGVYSFVDFEIAGPITLTNLVIGLGNDEVAGSMNRRTISNIRVYAGLTPATVQDHLVADIDLDPEYTAAYGDRIPVVDIDLDVNGQFFRIEFMEPWDSGSRIYEIDGYGATYVLPPARPAEILDSSMVDPGVLRLVIDAPDLASRYRPESTTDLLAAWANVLHSDTPGGPYYNTNLSYSSSEGTNEVIYVVPTPAAQSEFFKIIGD